MASSLDRAKGNGGVGRSPFDGITRTADEEEKINSACRAALTSPTGKAMMAYIRSITLNAVVPAGEPDSVLWDREGMRRLAFILDARSKTTPKDEKQ